VLAAEGWRLPRHQVATQPPGGAEDAWALVAREHSAVWCAESAVNAAEHPPPSDVAGRTAAGRWSPHFRTEKGRLLTPSPAASCRKAIALLLCGRDR